MKWLLKLVVVAAIVWSGYWYIGAQTQEKLYASLLENSRAEGWTAESGNLGVAGFPSRFDTTLTDLNFATPDGDWGWRGEKIQIIAQSYQPNHIVMSWSGTQVVDTPAGSATITSEMLRASIVVAPKVALPLSRLQLEGQRLELEDTHWQAKIETLNLALFQEEDTPRRYRLGANLTNITPPDSTSSFIGGGTYLPEIIERIHLSALLDFDGDINREALDSRQPPKPVSAIIETATIIWGSSELSISGELKRADNGYVEGQLAFEVKGWQPLFDVFKQASSLTTTEKITLRRALDSAAGGGNLAFTLVLDNGEARIGPFIVGPAPVYPF
ncbi:MAG: DUF2125 domain-containing protein [Rhodobacteraceae bacterium]|nr:DUF2125 domain-containing protein [Paracoccaceae bacterium]